ncbi:MAG: ureidoglycolate lyase [Candidatus Bathyarchaeia archaeon]
MLKQTDGMGNIKFQPTIVSFYIDGEIEIGLCQVKKDSNTLKFMEKHARTPELIVPIKGSFILPVALSHNPLDVTESPSAADVEAFFVRSNQALVMNNGVWHSAPFPIGKETTFFVIFKKDTSKNDVIFKNFKNNEMVKIVI